MTKREAKRRAWLTASSYVSSAAHDLAAGGLALLDVLEED